MTESSIHRALAAFNDGDAFYDHLSDDVVLEFPYGPTLGLPDHVAGKAQVRDRLGAAQAGGLRLSDPIVVSAGAGRYLTEYTGTYRSIEGNTAKVPLIAVIEHDGQAITRIREYWDTLRLATLSTTPDSSNGAARTD